MDKYFSKITAIFSKFKTRKVLYIKEHINPSRDWNIFLSVSFFVFVVGFAYAFYIFGQINSGELFSKPIDTTNSNLVKINQVLLDKTITEINNKQTIRDNIGKNVPRDPSL